MHKNICILDPDSYLRDAFKWLLELGLPKEKYNYLFPETPAELINYLNNPKVSQNSILIGINNYLGKGNQRGIDVVNDISKITKIPLILYSDEEHFENRGRAMEVGALEYFILAEESKDSIRLARFIRRYFPENNSSCSNYFITI